MLRVELVRRYSNRSDLQERLAEAHLKAVGQGERQNEPDESSVMGWTSSVWRVRDRLSDEDVSVVIARFKAGTPKHELATEFGLSSSSIKALLRRHGVRGKQ